MSKNKCYYYLLLVMNYSEAHSGDSKTLYLLNLTKHITANSNMSM